MTPLRPIASCWFWHPDLADAQVELGESLQRVGRYADSLMPFRQATVSRSASAAAFNNLGIAWRAHDRVGPAQQAFRTAVLLKPDGAKSYANLASVLRRGAQHTAAIVNAQRAARIEPQAADHWLEVGQSRYAAKKYDGAVAAYRMAADRDPDGVKPLWLLAELLSDTGQTDDAIPLYRRVLELAPDDPFGAGLALAHLGVDPTPEQAPAAHLRALYDQYAESFDADLVGNLAYQGRLSSPRRSGKCWGPDPSTSSTRAAARDCRVSPSGLSRAVWTGSI